MHDLKWPINSARIVQLRARRYGWKRYFPAPGRWGQRLRKTPCLSGSPYKRETRGLTRSTQENKQSRCFGSTYYISSRIKGTCIPSMTLRGNYSCSTRRRRRSTLSLGTTTRQTARTPPRPRIRRSSSLLSLRRAARYGLFPCMTEMYLQFLCAHYR